MAGAVGELQDIQTYWQIENGKIKREQTIRQPVEEEARFFEVPRRTVYFGTYLSCARLQVANEQGGEYWIGVGDKRAVVGTETEQRIG